MSGTTQRLGPIGIHYMKCMYHRFLYSLLIKK